MLRAYVAWADFLAKTCVGSLRMPKDCRMEAVVATMKLSFLTYSDFLNEQISEN